jgi:hypothetical protein
MSNYLITIKKYEIEKGYISIQLTNESIKSDSISLTIFSNKPEYMDIVNALAKCFTVDRKIEDFTIPANILTFQGNIMTDQMCFAHKDIPKNNYDVIVKRFTTSFVEVKLVNHDDDSDKANTKFRKDSEQTGFLYNKIVEALKAGDIEITEEGILLPNTVLTGQIIIAVI